MDLSIDSLRRILNPLMDQKVLNLELDVLNKLLEGFHTHFPAYKINTKQRVAAFIAQAAHETGGFQWFFELGGKSYFDKYEPGTRIGKNLGNTEKGDGHLFRGRGIFHLTGRFNYQHYSELLGLDFVQDPDLAADPIIACHIACAYWEQKKLNPLADEDDLEEITRRINGGTNGLKDRERYYALLKSVMPKSS